MNQSDKILIMIPTYNEVDNISVIILSIRNLGMNLDLLFVDDNSPDGTGDLLDQMAKTDQNIHVLHRPGKLGVGSAHLDGIRWCYQHGYDILITMDSDLTHSPGNIPKFLYHIQDSAVVVGSRFHHPESLPDWVWWRKLMTHTGHFLTTTLLNLPYDATGAFRVYRLSQIPLGIFEMVKHRGYSFFFESLHRLHINGIAIKELPIILPARAYGHSKMNLKDVTNGIRDLIRLAIRTKFSFQEILYRETLKPAWNEPLTSAEEEWDSYWTQSSHRGKWIYDLIAIFYRRFIISPVVNHFLGRYFAPDSLVLHAGCGGGIVDIGISKKMQIDALDISTKALTEYSYHHTGKYQLIHGSIFDIPVHEQYYDGVFNLGVMEHFSEEEIVPILCEFNRVLKMGKFIIIFWPPAYGLSVIVLKQVHKILHKISDEKIQLHPPEITYIVSKEQTINWLESSGFALDQFYFGIRDFFTYQVIVAKKVRHLDVSEKYKIGL